MFELTPTGTETVLYSFGRGFGPRAGLIFDRVGNLYGTTLGDGDYGLGAVFKLTPQAGGGWTETVLHSFLFNGTDGAGPLAGLIFDRVGNLYGTTTYGGTGSSCGQDACGTVFELLTPIPPCFECSHSDLR